MWQRAGSDGGPLCTPTPRDPRSHPPLQTDGRVGRALLSRPPLNGSIVTRTATMSQLSKEQSRERWAGIRALFCQWDPIGVMDDSEWPRDEYDCMWGRAFVSSKKARPTGRSQTTSVTKSPIISDSMGTGPTAVGSRGGCEDGSRHLAKNDDEGSA